MGSVDNVDQYEGVLHSEEFVQPDKAGINPVVKWTGMVAAGAVIVTGAFVAGKSSGEDSPETSAQAPTTLVEQYELESNNLGDISSDSQEATDGNLEVVVTKWADQLVDSSKYEVSSQTIYILPELAMKGLDAALDSGSDVIIRPMFISGEQGDNLSSMLYSRFSEYADGSHNASIWLEERPAEIQRLLNPAGTVIAGDLTNAYLSFKIVISEGPNADVVDEQWAILEYISGSEAKEDPNNWKINHVQFVEIEQ